MNTKSMHRSPATTGLIVLGVVLLALGAGCEKYPEDTPKWVREKIRYCAMEKNNCRGLSIIEYVDNGEFYYITDEEAVPFSDENLYDFQGNLLCTADFIIPGSNYVCDGFSLSGLVRTRTVWMEPQEE